VYDTVLVGGVERRGQLHRIRQHGRAGKLPALREPIAQAHPLDELECDPGDTVLLEGLQDRDGVRVRDTRGRLALAEEATAKLHRAEQLGERALEGNLPVEVRITRLKDDAHPAATDFAQDFVVADALTGDGDLRVCFPVVGHRLWASLVLGQSWGT
jgi:hypothetical protein